MHSLYRTSMWSKYKCVQNLNLHHCLTRVGTIYLHCRKKKRRKNPHKNTCKLIPSISDWIFIHTCTSTTPAQPPAPVSDARTGSTFIWQPGCFLPHHCQGLAQEHEASGSHSPSETVPPLFILSHGIKMLMPDSVIRFSQISCQHEDAHQKEPQSLLPSKNPSSLLSNFPLLRNSSATAATVFCTAQYHLLPASYLSVYIDLYIDLSIFQHRR